MSDDKLIRLENFRAVVSTRGLKPADLSTLVGGRYTYWRDLLAGEKAFGEKAARKIEEKLKPPLPRGWLDQSHSDRPMPSEVAAEPPTPPGDFADRLEISLSDWALLQDIKNAATSDEIATIQARARRLDAHFDHIVQQRLQAAKAATQAGAGKAPASRPTTPAEHLGGMSNLGGLGAPETAAHPAGKASVKR